MQDYVPPGYGASVRERMAPPLVTTKRLGPLYCREWDNVLVNFGNGIKFLSSEFDKNFIP